MVLPPHLPGRHPAGLCVFGLTYACGLAWADTPKANPRPATVTELVDVVAESGLSSLELPARLLPTDPAERQALRRAAEDRGLGFVMAGGLVCGGELERDLRIAAELGAPVLRCILSSILCGQRGAMVGGWPEHLDRCTAELERRLPQAERLGIAIAVENHQDADSEDLLRLCERFQSRYLGVTLDCANPLAVMEEPVEFARRLAPWLRHAHLKDYRIYHAPEGCRLVRVALGQGVVDFPALFELFDAQEWPITRSIEMAALHARLIPFLESAWWDSFLPRDVREAVPALRTVWANLRPADEEWRTPLELDASGEELLEYEWRQFRTSVEYLKKGVSGCSS
jgi:sugar phosphate isomerase/epimerase